MTSSISVEMACFFLDMQFFSNFKPIFVGFSCPKIGFEIDLFIDTGVECW